MIRVIVDTNVFVGACLGGGASNEVVALALTDSVLPLMGNALFAEYEDVLARQALFQRSKLNAAERSELFDVFLSRCDWTRVYYQWRPNLRDEADNHLLELAVAGGAHYIITRNIRDLKTGQLSFPHITVVTPEAFLKEFRQ